MNLPPLHASRSPQRAPRQSGSAVIVVMALVAIILVYVTANLKTLANLGRELKLLERQQVRRLPTVAAGTNAPPGILLETNEVLRARPM